MNNEMTCAEVEPLIFELRRGELSDVKKTEVDQHLRKCATCRQLAEKMDLMFQSAIDADAEDWADIDAAPLFARVEAEVSKTSAPEVVDPDQRLDDMFEAARTADDDAWGSFDSDALFDRIAGQVAQKKDTADVVELRPEQSVDEDETPRGGRGWIGVIVAAAACAAVVAWWGFEIGSPAPTDSSADRPAPELASSHSETQTDDPATTGAKKNTDDATKPSFSLPPMQPVTNSRESVKLFASSDARFDLDEENAPLRLRQGSVLVEYLPEARSEFAVRSHGYTVTVVGTVFSVNARAEGDVRIAVFEGAVRVTNPDGSTVEVESGEFVAPEGRGKLTETTTTEASRYVDLKAHRALLAARRTAERSAKVVAPDLLERGEPKRPEPQRGEPKRAETKLAKTKPAEPTDSKTQRPVERTASTDEPPSKSNVGAEPTSAVEPPENETPEEAPPSDEPTVANARPTSAPPARTRQEVEHDEARELRRAALEARHQGQHRRAVDLLAQALQKTPATDRAAADILLELAQIHLKKLHQPDEAARYLRRFARQWPHDPAADAIRGQLCNMEEVEAAESFCDR